MRLIQNKVELNDDVLVIVDEDINKSMKVFCEIGYTWKTVYKLVIVMAVDICISAMSLDM